MSLEVSMKHIFLNKEGNRCFLTHVFQPTTVKTESRIRHGQNQTNEEKTPTNKNKQTPQQNRTCKTKTNPLMKFLSELHRAWTEAVKTVTKGYYHIF